MNYSCAVLYNINVHVHVHVVVSVIIASHFHCLFVF